MVPYDFQGTCALESKMLQDRVNARAGVPRGSMYPCRVDFGV